MKRWLGRIVLVFIVAACFWYTFSQVNFDQLWFIVSKSNVAILVSTIPISIASHIVRAVRWRRLLNVPSSTVPLGETFRATMVGYASSLIAPRSGEVVRPLMLSSKTDIPVGASISSVVVERLLDVLCLSVGIGTLATFHHQTISALFPDVSANAITLSLLLPALVLISSLYLIAYTKAPLVITHSISTRLPRLGQFLEKTLKSVKQGTSILTSTRNWLWIGLDSTIMWLLYAIPLWMIVSAMPMSIGSISFMDAFTLLVIISIGISIAPTPGAMGVYHGVAQAALVRLFHATPDEGLGFALVAWVLNYGTQLAVGGICLLWQRGSRSKP